MPISFDEISAEVETPRTPVPEPSSSGTEAAASPETELRRLRERLSRLEQRAARVRAD